MKKINLKKGRYLIAVSGGPDSMALLDMCARTDNHIEVAHVNYHKRDSALNDEKLVRRYCLDHKIVFHRLNVYPDNISGNFQEEARNIRYSYFYRLCKRNRLDAVILGHQQDDLLETYIMQKKKKLGVSYYGLKKETVINGVKVIRPLLQYQKKELENYCLENNIAYGIDESNLSDAYTRNYIRHHELNNLSKDKRNKLLNEIKEKNRLKEKEEKEIKRYLKKDSYDYKDFIKIPVLIGYLRYLFPHKSDKHYKEIIRQLKQSESYIYNENNIYLVKEYGKINIFDKPEEYEYVFKSLKQIKKKDYKYFKIVGSSDNFHGATLQADDFPVKIRNYHEKDEIKMRYGTKKINRYFIDNKIYLKDRLSYPIILDKNDTAILVPGIGCDYRHYSNKANLYVIKL